MCTPLSAGGGGELDLPGGSAFEGVDTPVCTGCKFMGSERPFQERCAIARALAHACAKVFRHVINGMLK